MAEVTPGEFWKRTTNGEYWELHEPLEHWTYGTLSPSNIDTGLGITSLGNTEPQSWTLNPRNTKPLYQMANATSGNSRLITSVANLSSHCFSHSSAIVKIKSGMNSSLSSRYTFYWNANARKTDRIKGYSMKVWEQTKNTFKQCSPTMKT